MADRWGALTIAEGVETPAQLRTIRRLGIAAGQGYLLGRPGPDRDLAWIDLEALESREDDAGPLRAEPVMVGAVVADLDPVPQASAGVLASVRSRTMTLRRTSKDDRD